MQNGSKLTRSQARWLRVGEAPRSLHGRASMPPPGAPFSRARMQKSGPLDHHDYPIDMARGPPGGRREPIKRVSNEALQGLLCAPGPPRPPPQTGGPFQPLSLPPLTPRPRVMTSQARVWGSFLLAPNSRLVSCLRLTTLGTPSSAPLPASGGSPRL